MSFVKEVLSTAHETNLQAAKRDMLIISNYLLDYKQNATKFFEDVYVQFLDCSGKAQYLTSTSTRLATQLNIIWEEIKRLEDTGSKDFIELGLEFKQLQSVHDAASKLIEMHNLFRDMKNSKSTNQLMEAIQQFTALQQILNNTNLDEVTDAVVSFKRLVLLEKISLIETLTDIVKEHVQYVAKKPKLGNVEVNSLTVKKKNESFSNTLSMLANLGVLNHELDKLVKFLHEYICKPVSNKNAKVTIVEDAEINTLTVYVKKSSTELPYQDLFQNLTQVFTFVHENLDYKLVDDIQVVTYIKEKIKIDSFLKDVIIKNGENENFLTDLRTFQIYMMNLGFLDSVPEMNQTVINIKYQNYLSEAIALMKQNLEDKVMVGTIQNENDSITSQKFPCSYISKHVTEILQLAQDILDLACKEESESVTADLIYIVQTIFKQYGEIVQEHHKFQIQFEPKLVALFRNNCMYLAHVLITLNTVYSSEKLQMTTNCPQMFTSEIQKLRAIGSKTFLNYVTEQRKQLKSILKDPQYSDYSERIQKCMKWFELIRNVWFNLLPALVCNKTVGHLFNWFCEKLITEIVVDDVTTTTTGVDVKELLISYEFVQKEGPKLFQENPDEIDAYVKSWRKFNDLVSMSDATLLDITDRWANGKGSLASTFNSQEIDRIVKVLFNTELPL